MCDTALNSVYQAVVIAKFCLVGFYELYDRQRIEAFVRRGIRCGFSCSANKTIQQLVEESDQSLFKRVLNDNYHVLNGLLPDKRRYCYNLRDRAHNRELHITSRLLDCNFLTRLLFKDSY